MTARKLKLVKEEFNSYFNQLRDLESRKYHCVFNAVAFIVTTNFKYDHLYITGHNACINNDTIVDPTIGCAWFYTGNYEEKIVNILSNVLEPDLKADWFDHEHFPYWWDYTHKYKSHLNTNTLPTKWDVAIKIIRRKISPLKGKSITVGKFSDYVQN